MGLHFQAVTTEIDARSVARRQPLLLPPAQQIYRTVFKRVLDVTLVLLMLPFVLPLVVLLAFLISRDGGSPFYTQKRVGFGGRVFTLWKLRTMVPDADAKLGRYLAENDDARHQWDAYQKLTHDPRITTLGRLLRISSLDELPQLWNVLMGDMSLVGPRPMMPEQLPLYPGTAYFALRPGLTGMWQVSDRNASTFAQRAEFDATYYGKLSFVADIKLLVATIGVVLRCTGR